MKEKVLAVAASTINCIHFYILLLPSFIWKTGDGDSYFTYHLLKGKERLTAHICHQQSTDSSLTCSQLLITT